MASAARNLLLHPWTRGGLYGLAAALALQSFFDTWQWWIFAGWGVVMVTCLVVAVRNPSDPRTPRPRQT